MNDDIRIVVHKTRGGLLLCYVGHHDDAYHWAERRKIETHPTTGAAQIVEIVERVVEQAPQRAAVVTSAEPPAEAKRGPALFADQADDALLGFGVPYEWLEAVKLTDEDGLFEIAPHLPEEAAEALLELAVGGRPQPRAAARSAEDDAFAHPDSQRRFRIVADAEELRRALDYPWEQWLVFLHPSQREVVERRFGGPARVTGSAGTGKTVVALHRTAYLARRSPHVQVLLATFSKGLAHSLRMKLRRLMDTSDPAMARTRWTTSMGWRWARAAAPRGKSASHGVARHRRESVDSSGRHCGPFSSALRQFFGAGTSSPGQRP